MYLHTFTHTHTHIFDIFDRKEVIFLMAKVSMEHTEFLLLSLSFRHPWILQNIGGAFNLLAC